MCQIALCNLEFLIPLPLPHERRAEHWAPHMLGAYVLLRLPMHATALALEQLFESLLNLMPNTSDPTLVTENSKENDHILLMMRVSVQSLQCK